MIYHSAALMYLQLGNDNIEERKIRLHLLAIKLLYLKVQSDPQQLTEMDEYVRKVWKGKIEIHGMEDGAETSFWVRVHDLQWYWC